METLESIKNRIKSTQDLQSVVRTMKTLSSVNIRNDEKAVETLLQYAQVMERGLQILLRGPAGIVPWRTSVETPGRDLKQGIIVFGSDQGLCGPFNEQIVRFTLSYLHNTSSSTAMIVVGQRAAEILEDTGIQMNHGYSVPSSLAGITPLVQDLLLEIDSWQTGGWMGGLWLLYNQPLSSTSYRSTIEQVLPLDQKWLSELSKKPWPTRQIPTYLQERSHLLATLIQHYLFISLYKACVGSLASENAARLVAMQNADRAIEDKITSLTGSFHRTRQTQITEEILDIISGFESLTAAPHLEGPRSHQE